MDTSEVFLKRTIECEQMAKFTRDAASKATWTRMAERWHRLAELEIAASLAAAQHGSHRHRSPAHGWSRH